MTQRVRQRVLRLVLIAAILAVGLGLRSFATGQGAKYGGVALYAVLVYVLVSIVWVRAKPGRVFGVSLAICVAVELFQLTPIPTRLAEVNRGFALVFGTTFHWPDLIAYAAGCAVAAGVHCAADGDGSPER